MTEHRRMIVTGGAGFVGSFLCERYIAEGWHVTCLDNLSTGTVSNLAALRSEPRFELLERDVAAGLGVTGRVDAVVHLASPASPRDYHELPLATMKVGAEGTRNALELASEHGARFLLASTSEVYGDPEVHPQPETYWGNVNPVGPRAVYDEAKRFAEAMTMAYRRARRVHTHIVRIFNTYGPRMRPADGRVVPTFLTRALRHEPMPIFGDGSQSRSFCYVGDLVEGLHRMLESDESGPINLGNPAEVTIGQLAQLCVDLTGSRSRIIFEPLPVDDPRRRQPDITLARERLGWEPKVELSDGLLRAAAWTREALAAEDAASLAGGTVGEEPAS